MRFWIQDSATERLCYNKRRADTGIFYAQSIHMDESTTTNLQNDRRRCDIPIEIPVKRSVSRNILYRLMMNIVHNRTMMRFINLRPSKQIVPLCTAFNILKWA